MAKSWGNPEVTAQITAEGARYAGVLFGSVRGTVDMNDGAFFFHPLRVYDGSATVSLGHRALPPGPRAAPVRPDGDGEGVPDRASAGLSRPRVSDLRTPLRELPGLRNPARCGVGRRPHDPRGRGRLGAADPARDRARDALARPLRARRGAGRARRRHAGRTRRDRAPRQDLRSSRRRRRGPDRGPRVRPECGRRAVGQALVRAHGLGLLRPAGPDRLGRARRGPVPRARHPGEPGAPPRGEADEGRALRNALRPGPLDADGDGGALRVAGPHRCRARRPGLSLVRALHPFRAARRRRGRDGGPRPVRLARPGRPGLGRGHGDAGAAGHARAPGPADDRGPGPVRIADRRITLEGLRAIGGDRLHGARDARRSRPRPERSRAASPGRPTGPSSIWCGRPSACRVG